MSSTSGGRGLPSINSPDHTRTGDEKPRRTQSREMPGRGYSLQRVISTSRTSRARRNLGNNQPSRQVALGESSNEQHHSVHNRNGRSSSMSVEDSGQLRNWNTEGGRPKRERTFSDRSSTRRLLHRSSVNSVGELIPFQRAPRDGSYESHLPMGKKATSQRLAKKDSNRELLNLDLRWASSLKESLESSDGQSSNSVAGMAGKASSMSLDGQKRQSVKAKGTNMKSDGRRDGSRVTRKSIQEVNDTKKGLSEAKRRECAQNDVTSQGITLSQEEGLVTNNEATQSNSSTTTVVAGLSKNAETSKNVAATTSSEDTNGQNMHSQQSKKGSNSQSAYSDFINDDNEDEPVFRQNIRVTSPSAEFKVAAQEHSTASTVQPSTSTIPTTSTNLVTHHCHQTLLNENLDDVHVHVASSLSRNDNGTQDNLSANQQPNSVVRRGMNSSETVDTSKLQPGQVSAPLLIARQHLRRDHNLSHSEEASSGNSTVIQNNSLVGPESSSQIGSDIQPHHSPRDEAVSVSPGTNTVQPPSSVNINHTAPEGSNATSQQNRLGRFGRRIRMPSSEVTETQESDQPSHEASQAPEPVTSEERFEGTHRQRYRFFSLSRDRSESDNTIHVPTLTPNRDLLYGLSSPPLMRRHHRIYFGSGTSNVGHSSEEQGVSAGIQSSLDSSVSDDNVDLREDSFRTASGSTAIFAPVLQSGPLLDSSLSSVSHQRLHETGPTARISSDSSFSSSDTNSPREQYHLLSSQQSQPAVDVDRSSDYDHNELSFSVDEGLLTRDARRRYQSDRNDAFSRLLPQMSHQPSRELPRGAEIMEDVFGLSRNRTDLGNRIQPPLQEATMDLQIPLLSSPLFAPLGIAPGMLLNLLIRTRREFGQEFMELLLENMMLNVLAHRLFEMEQDGNEDGIHGAPPPAAQDIIDNLKAISALEMHIEKEMKCAICHNEYELYETLAELPCLHFFHPTCVAIWLKKSGTCPVCRFQLSSPTK